ncbi:hypothetical protein LTR08_004057 [Meristemomyces frigidus]|nr:hypothetical protein LTR08_004057 [Meristemomyces frigidus]
MYETRGFEPPSPTSTPHDLFTHTAYEDDRYDLCHETAHRFVRRTDDRERLVYLDGSCLDQTDRANVSTRRAGCAFVFKPEPYSPQEGIVGFRLEAEGPTGRAYPQTSNRAELRAAIAVLQYLPWNEEGCDTLVLATDSEYVVLGITQRIAVWMERGWTTSARTAVKNRDLWECLLAEVNKFASRGMEVVFWRIPREWNTEADAAARQAASTHPFVSELAELNGGWV